MNNKSYVYVLIDPNTNEIFYVGKGTKYRDKSHLKSSLWKNPEKTTNPFLYYKIRSLMENNNTPIIKRLYENLSNKDAYEKEHEIILRYGRRFSEERGKLFNISKFKGGSNAGKSMPWTEDRKKKYKLYCKTRRKYDPTYEELYDDYIVKNMLRSEISKKYNISTMLVKKRLAYFGIKKQKALRYPEKNKYICSACKKIFFTPKSVKNRKHCSRKCYLDNRYKHEHI